MIVVVLSVIQHLLTALEGGGSWVRQRTAVTVCTLKYRQSNSTCVTMHTLFFASEVTLREPMSHIYTTQILINGLLIVLNTCSVQKLPAWSLHKLMGIYMGDLILGVMVYASFSCFYWL